MSTRSFIEELEFDLPGALKERLVELFEEMPSAVLYEEALNKVD